jgi:hypothetical protein
MKFRGRHLSFLVAVSRVPVIMCQQLLDADVEFVDPRAV